MCGIAGIVNKTARPVNAGRLMSMTNAVRHRGPDGEGHFIAGNVGLGHRRLAIIDLSTAANQPMHSADGRLTIVFNGEIYNYIEIRQELIQRGHRFSTKSDTEVILAAYAEWGSDCVHRFNGMWGFALHDRSLERLFCSRDRFGVKPFYYVDNAEVFAFGSEIKQLLDFLPARRADGPVLETFLTTGLVDYSDHTFFEGVRKLLPGHNLVVNTATGAIHSECYYNPEIGHPEGTDEGKWEQRFLELLSDSVELRLRSDVPVGSCLSGGLDSSAIVSLAAPRYRARSNREFCAITAISSNPATDESRYARQVVDQCGLRWLTTRQSAQEVMDASAQLVYHQDEPIPSLSPMMQFFVMRKARENGIPVLLDGQGADELLLGYAIYLGMYIRSALRERGPLAAAQAFRQACAHNSRMPAKDAIRYTVGLGTPRFRHLRSRIRCPWLKGSHSTPRVLIDSAASLRNLYTFQRNEMGSATLPALLRYEDRNSMAFAIETRLPFLDYRLVEMCLGLPLQGKIRDGWTKWILRSAMRGILPESILWRKDKIGFEAPEALWMGGNAETVRRTVLSSELVQSVTREGILKAALSRISLRERWRLFSVALWSRQFEVASVAECGTEEVPSSRCSATREPAHVA